MTSSAPDLAATSFDAMLRDLAAKSPAPGGGAAAAWAGAIAAGLAHMVVAYSIGRKSAAERTPDLERAAAKLGTIRAALLDLAREDAEAFLLTQETAREEGCPMERRVAAALAAVNAPRGVVALCAEILRELESIRDACNPHLGSDLRAAAELALGAAHAAKQLVAINIPALEELEKHGAAQSPGWRAPRELLEEAGRVVAGAAERRRRLVEGDEAG